MNRTEKEEVVSELNETFNESGVLVVTHYKGLTVEEVSELRDRVRENGASFRVTKNRLTRLALAGTKFENCAELFTGPTAIAYGEDAVGATKACVNFAKDNDKFEVIGGSIGGDLLDDKSIKTLASLPSLDELRAKIISIIQTPATKIAGVTAAPAGQLARVFNAYATK